MAAQELCLHALSKAVDVLPDSFWHGIPGGFFKPSKDKKELKEKIEEREKEVESKLTRHHNRRRTSEEHKSGRGRHADDRKDRRRRAASASPHSKQYSDEDREHRRGRRGRERNSDDKHESQKRNDMSTNDYYLPMSLAGLNGVAGSRPSTAQSSHPSQAYSPAAYAGSPIAQAPPYQHPTQPAQTAIYSRHGSLQSSSSPSTQPTWSATSSRCSSVYQQKGTSPPTGYSPLTHANTMPPSPPQAWEAHPAYHGGSPPSTAATRYTPGNPQYPHTYTHSPALAAQQSLVVPPQQYASPSITPTQQPPFPKPQASPFVAPQLSPITRSQTSPSIQSQVSPMTQPQTQRLPPSPFPQFQMSPNPQAQVPQAQLSPFPAPQNSPNYNYYYSNTHSPHQQQQSAALQSPPALSLQSPISRHGSVSQHAQQPGVGNGGVQSQQRPRPSSASSTAAVVGAAYAQQHAAGYGSGNGSRRSSGSSGYDANGGPLSRHGSVSRRESLSQRTRHHSRVGSGLREQLAEHKEEGRS